MKYLTFQLYSPMASWGDTAVGEVRPSLSHPTRSALYGLIAAALGIERREEDRHIALWRSIRIAFQVDSMGSLLRDYHTVQMPGERRNAKYFTRKDELAIADPNTILSSREYRTDALYRIVIAETATRSDYDLNTIEQALRTPKFLLYLGRKSCPLSLPLVPQTIEATTLEEAFGHIHLPEPIAEHQRKLFERPFKKEDGTNHIYWDISEWTESEVGFCSETIRHQIAVRDMPTSRSRWQFAERRLVQLSLHPNALATIEKGDDNVPE